ncbi:hypothetical protein HID58_081704 [Brassica napus]|uniref:Uncharacterized protein n=1 Tax=Brassica napus TaxID=3708 RepID=A0ABQ7YB65_BRANA|nr:hypothetical protein HID58_081704 [Brassica napus]
MLGGGLWFEELVSGHCLHGGRVASWFGQPPVHGGPLSSRVSDSFVLVWVGEADGLVVFVLVGPDVPALVTITYFLLVMAWSCSQSGGVLGVHSPLCSSVVLLELLSFSSVGDVQMV